MRNIWQGRYRIIIKKYIKDYGNDVIFKDSPVKESTCSLRHHQEVNSVVKVELVV